MNYVLRLHFEKSYKEWVLPDVNNQTLNYIVKKELCGLERDINFKLNVYDGIWSLNIENPLIITGKSEGECTLQNNELLYAEYLGHKFNVSFHLITNDYLQFTKYKIPNSAITIGRLEDNTISFDFENNVSGHHAELRAQNGIYGLYDMSRNGTYINGCRVGEYKNPQFRELNYGDEIYILGLKIIYLKDVLAINRDYLPNVMVHLEEDMGETLKITRKGYADIYERSPRKVRKLETESVVVEGAPNPAQNRRQPLLLTIGPSLTMVIPMAIGVLFTQWSYSQSGMMSNSAFMYMGIVTSVTSAIIGVGWALVNIRFTSKQAKEDENKRVLGYGKYIDKIKEMLNENGSYNLNAYNEKYPTSEIWLSWIPEQYHRVWENNLKHEDFLDVRIGTGTIKNPVEIVVPKERFSLIDDKLQEQPHKIYEEFKNIEQAPVLLNLKRTRLLGIVGEKRIDILHVLIAQLASRYSYDEVKTVFLFNQQNEEIEMMKWLPHTWTDNRRMRLVSQQKEEWNEILYLLNNEIRTRMENKNASKIPHYILVAAQDIVFEDEYLVKVIENNDLGMSLIVLADHVEKLPNSCNEVLEDQNGGSYLFLDEKEEGNHSFTFDYISKNTLQSALRALSNYRIQERGSVGAVPEMITYMQMLHIRNLAQFNIYRKWLENRTYKSMRSLIGLKAGNQPLYLDIHEKVHGPHGLVAGTTGSGKSELLQTYILSLAMNYHPYEVSFILIDYKGGGMAQSFECLPHTSGIITNLGGNQTTRALASINSEIRRRQKIFNDYRIKHIDEYIEMFRNEKVDMPIPHLIMIADEFAELKKEQPNFVKDLVSASRVGRSLGIHLILATQKPSGVVDEEIWGNSKFRICLRVQDKQDSKDMLKRTEAAYITNVGRAYLQVGNDEIFEEFQSAWSGAPYVEDQEGIMDNYPLRLIELLGRKMPGKKKKEKTKENVQSQLDTAVYYIRKTFEENKVQTLKPIWLPPLKRRIGLEEIPLTIQENRLDVCLGIVDDPVRQHQFPFLLNLIDSGHIMVSGSIGSGKTTLLQTLVYSLINNNDVNTVHVYIADFGSKTMNIYQNAPQVGAVLFENESSRLHKLIKTLIAELGRRKTNFAKKGIVTFREYFKKYSNCPAFIFVVDNYASMMEENPKIEDDLFLLSREGSAYGIFMIFSCLGSSEIKTRIRTNFQTGIGLQLNDRFEYESVLQGKIEMLPESKTPGRGLIKSKNECLEFQTALILDSTNSEETHAYIVETIEHLKLKTQGKKALTIPSIPSEMVIKTFVESEEVKCLRNSPRYLPIGYDLEEIEIVKIDLSKLFCFCVSGLPRSGKSNFLKLIAALKKDQNADVYVISENSSMKSEFESFGVKSLITNDKELFDVMNEKVVPEFILRNKTCKAQYNRNPDIEMDEYLGMMKPIFVLIDSMQFFIDTIYSSEKNMSRFFEMCFEKGEKHGIYFFAAIAPNDYQNCLLRPAFKEFVSWKTGLHFGGQADQQRIFDFDIALSERSKKLKAGVAWMIEETKTIRLAVPKANKI
ncbi:type VII secretion protein EssC [Holdemania massiliensis]|uniref:type VII secretion protein EssC n=1 Tax=Holdemania massiliensis TaxID=1468449 RepID=UPI00030748E8|nr:type VII secretion protein EssC [Holdemania massiliensis]